MSGDGWRDKEYSFSEVMSSGVVNTVSSEYVFRANAVGCFFVYKRIVSVSV